jgi:hypothetical protein
VSGAEVSGSDSEDTNQKAKIFGANISDSDDLTEYNMFRENDNLGKVTKTDKPVNLQNTHDMIILGIVSGNKELFLFDRHVSMSQSIERWLDETQRAM